ncbi:hypothetical protein PYW08_010953 [Mythimna loreyi]|uniref:Uncharacterized protein n=1 Tax=Mythimna loreyi TaxID=667449 RepID=A0ACC2Q217_9NEOP|nr:hypothetical protein PYW08_010953 [Mythimna loreyi]
MPELVEQMYCSQQIVIPPKYPYILKRYCKAAIKTQPYDLLRWSFEYFKALAEHRPPPVKLRLEYPIYSTEGGLTRGCLKVLAHQLYPMKEIPLFVLKQAWQGFCLDRIELKRILCLCEVYLREETVPFFHFLSVAGGMLTKCLTHTMILLCESLTKEPDGGSAAIPVEEFLKMYRYLAVLDASKDVQYLNGYREGSGPPSEHEEEEESIKSEGTKFIVDSDEDNFWEEDEDLQRVSLINDNVAKTARLSMRLTRPTLGRIERSPSIERMTEIERENYTRQRTGKAEQSEEVNRKLKEMSSMMMAGDMDKDKPLDDADVGSKDVTIVVYDEEEQPVEYEIYGEPKEVPEEPEVPEVPGEAPAETEYKEEEVKEPEEEAAKEEEVVVQSEVERIREYLAEIEQARQERLLDLEKTFEEIAALVDRFKSANYDLGMVAGRQMSTTSGEFIVQHIEREIMEYIDEQIAILPDPDLKKKKAKPEEVVMIRELLEKFLDDNMDVIVPEIEEVEEEEEPLPEVVMVYAVPGIGGTVDAEIIEDFVEYIREVCKVQTETVMPRNIRHFLCPPLEKYSEPDYSANEVPPKEELATDSVSAIPK